MRFEVIFMLVLLIGAGVSMVYNLYDARAQDTTQMNKIFTQREATTGVDSMYVKSGGVVNVSSGGVVNFATGAYLKINNTAVTSTAAALNYNASVTPGTASASKTVVLGTTKNLDYIDLTDEGGGFAIRNNIGGAGSDSSVVITFSSGMPVITFNSASGAGAYTLTVTDTDVAAFAGAAGGYTFDAPIDGTDIKNTTIGAGGASSGAFTTLTVADIAACDVVGSNTGTNITYVAFRANEGGAGTDSSLTIGFDAGIPFMKWYGTDGDTFTQTMTTDDKATFTGAAGGYEFDAPVTATQFMSGNMALAPIASSQSVGNTTMAISAPGADNDDKILATMNTFVSGCYILSATPKADSVIVRFNTNPATTVKVSILAFED